AGMRRDQTRRLQLAGIHTMATLAASPPEPIQGINQAALDRLRRQAKLQVERKEAGDLTYEVLAPLGEHLGFQALPAPTPADLFFDMEGDPFVGEDGLEYLFGVTEMGRRCHNIMPSGRTTLRRRSAPSSKWWTSSSSGSIAIPTCMSITTPPTSRTRSSGWQVPTRRASRRLIDCCVAASSLTFTAWSGSLSR